MFRKTGISGQFQNRPEIPALHQLLNQALEKRGKQFQIVWRSPGAASFTLVVLCNMRGDPRWCLYSEQSGKRDLLFDYSSCDVLLVNNLITSSCAEAQKTGRSPFVANPNKAKVEPPIENFNPDPLIEPILVAPEVIDAPAADFKPATSAFEQPFDSLSRYEAPSPVPPPPPGEPLTLNPRSIDAAAIQGVMTSLRNQETGMFMNAAFLYFLEQEYFRSLRSRSSLSVIVFEIKEESPEDGNMVRKKLPPAAMVDAVMRITALKRHVDVLAHYDDDSFALLLPHTKSTGARTFATRLIRTLTEKPLGGMDPSHIAVSIGCSSIPEDFVDLSKLLGATDLTFDQARKTRSQIVMYSDIKNSVIVAE